MVIKMVRSALHDGPRQSRVKEGSELFTGPRKNPEIGNLSILGIFTPNLVSKVLY
jgi:hypothetical protein